MAPPRAAMSLVSEKLIIPIPIRRRNPPIIKSGSRPYLSDALPAMKRIEIDATTIMVLNSPLYLNPKPPTKSGVTVKKTPKVIATGSKNNAEGQTEVSILPPLNTFKSLSTTERLLGNVSGILKVRMSEIIPRIDETINIES